MQYERDSLGELVSSDPYAAVVEIRARALSYAEDPEVRHQAKALLRTLERATGLGVGLIPSASARWDRRS